MYYHKQKKVFDLEHLFLKYITKFYKATSNENFREDWRCSSKIGNSRKANVFV